MKRFRAEILTPLFAAIAVAATAYLTSALPTLREIDKGPLLAAGTVYCVVLCLYSVAWTILLLRRQQVPQVRDATESRACQPADPRPALKWNLSFALSLSSLFGILTPLTLGTDVLRSLHGRRFLALDLALTATASVRARVMKIQVTLLLLPVALPVAVSLRHRLLPILLSGFTLIVALLLLRFIGSGEMSRLAALLRIENLSIEVKAIDSGLGMRQVLSIYGAFVMQIVLEWLSVYLLLLSVGAGLRMRAALLLCVLLYFLSRAPFTPNALGVTEGGGFWLLASLGVPAARAGAFLVLWDFIRILCPLILAGPSYAYLRASRRPKSGVVSE